MDPCEVHEKRSDSSGLSSLGLVTWRACMAPEVAWLACMQGRPVINWGPVQNFIKNSTML
jgi:hypothetical protein